MKNRNKSMNGFQIFSGILYGLSIASSFTFLTNGNDLSFIICIVTSSILFYFMYALGEIVKQLRISNEIFEDSDNEKNN